MFIESSFKRISGMPWEPPTGGGCSEWMQYHKGLVPMYGREKANELWLYYWEKLSPWSNNKNWCKYNSEFNSYFKSQGIDVGNLLSDVFNTGGDVLDAATGAISTFAKIAKIGLPILGVYLVGKYFDVW
jgi:hypothetical protein